MKNELSVILNQRWNYLGKVLLTAIIYYVGVNLGNYLRFVLIFGHEFYAVYWPPAGICLALVMVWGRGIWPGIVIGSVFSTSDAWFDMSQLELYLSIIVYSIFATGRVLEPIAGQILLKKTNSDNPFKSPRNTFYFILIALGIAIISAGIATYGAQLLRHDSMEVLVIRTFGWYLDNLMAILIFTPFTYAVLKTKRKDLLKVNTWAPMLLLTVLTGLLIFYFSWRALPSVPAVLENALPFLIIPLLLWIAFNFSLLLTSYVVLLISIISIYLTSNGIGPFASGNEYQFSVWLLQSFLFVVSIAMLISYAASSERRENLKQLEKAKQKAEESDRLKSSFLANMSHEIRTPMNAIMGFAELLNRPHVDVTKSEEYTHLIRQRSKDLLAVVNDILDISKIESGQMTSKNSSGDIQELLNQLYDNFHAEVSLLHQKSIVISVNNELQGSENLVMADFARLNQVLSNLLHNAIKFTEQGSIEFGCRLQNSQTLLFYVKDSGIGIDPSKHEIIFKPFEQETVNTHKLYGGTGLGLAIIKGLVKLWDGEIWVESNVGKGASFFFTIPYLQCKQDQLN